MKIKVLLLTAVIAFVGSFYFVDGERLSAYVQACVKEERVLEGDSEGPETVSAAYNTARTADENLTPLEAYYSNLEENFGYNFKSSCGYIAMGMFLSYYDSYFDDSIIPEQYDVVSYVAGDNYKSWTSSPGVMNDEEAKYYNGEEIDKKNVSVSDNQYYENIEKLKDVSLHAKLITIGNSLGKLNWAGFSGLCGTDLSERIYILKTYFKDETDYREYNYEFIYKEEGANATESEIKQFIIENIDAGRPVMVGLYHKGLSLADPHKAHACIAYAHDGDTIYLHGGFQDRPKKLTITELGYNRFTEASTIIFKDRAHSCSNNYIVNNGNSSTHLAYCGCGASVAEDHIITYTNKTAYQHTAVCECGYSKTETHTWVAGTAGSLSLSSEEDECAEPFGLPSIGKTTVRCKYCNFIKEVSGFEPVPGGDYNSVNDLYSIPTISESDCILPVFDMRQHDGK